MTKEQLEARIAELVNLGKQAEIQIHNINGAIAECNNWLQKLEPVSDAS